MEQILRMARREPASLPLTLPSSVLALFIYAIISGRLGRGICWHRPLYSLSGG
jgi:hypothetical protein